MFRQHGGILRMSAALEAGISRRTLYTMHANGVLERLSPGVYRLTSLPGLEAPDLVTMATRIPNGVVCLISALAVHELITHVPHAVDIAAARGAESPRIDYPPINISWFSGNAFTKCSSKCFGENRTTNLDALRNDPKIVVVLQARARQA
ncbi:MAG: type IV toxin-antitoxin system AbiEi family antitoxin domain-containing protein [Gammaproteobacteria bacterium]